MMRLQKDRRGKQPDVVAWALARAWALGFLAGSPTDRNMKKKALLSKAECYAYENWHRYLNEAKEITENKL